MKRRRGSKAVARQPVGEPDGDLVLYALADADGSLRDGPYSTRSCTEAEAAERAREHAERFVRDASFGPWLPLDLYPQPIESFAGAAILRQGSGYHSFRALVGSSGRIVAVLLRRTPDEVERATLLVLRRVRREEA